MSDLCTYVQNHLFSYLFNVVFVDMNTSKLSKLLVKNDVHSMGRLVMSQLPLHLSGSGTTFP